MKYKTMKEVIDLLHANNINYAILRNYENLLDNKIYMDGHGDVDMICANSKEIIEVLGAYSQSTQRIDGHGDGTHYYIYVNNQQVSLDIRHIGDGYYCSNWQRDMLNRKVLFNGFYVLSPEDYFHTLIYHAIFQKQRFSEEYNNKLINMGKNLGLNITSKEIGFFVEILEKYMKKHHYTYLYPIDKYVPLKREYIQDKSLFVLHYKRYFQHLIFQLRVKFIELLVYLYHKTLKRN